MDGAGAGGEEREAPPAKRRKREGGHDDDGASFTYTELFAGVGGFGVACRRLGGRCVFASEIEPNARAAWLYNFVSAGAARRPGADQGPLRGDITKIATEDVPPHDLLLGGFPCQPFSQAGLQPGFETTDGVLYKQILRLLSGGAPPRMFLLENVPGLRTADEGRALHTILEDLDGCGYDVRCAEIDSAALLPQRRKRLYFVGFRRPAEGASVASAFAWPAVPDLTGARPLRAILDARPSAARFALTAAQWQRRVEMEPDRAAWLVDLDRAGPTLTKGLRRAPGRAAARRHVERGAGQGNWRNLVAHGEGAPRYLTARECARMHGYPEGFWLPLEERPDGPGAALMGNAVSPPVVAAILFAMRRADAVARGAAPDGHSAEALRCVLSDMLAAAVPPDAADAIKAAVKNAALCDVARPAR
eukprot:TRINITY_DN662_c0_g2_i2.p1 TRINITY_DN662_c0_g2~~TRINITY_DN662_c0_g2_i2.p1  ORF type:complete len:444 (+),score=121.13 TRINITY_DN662_c0_g2_i2:76-1332(+)